MARNERTAEAELRPNDATTPLLAVLTSWYSTQLRPLLRDHANHLAEELDDFLRTTGPRAARPHELRIGVVGEAGVGKSTLINALLSARLPILPQGGVGPLTATPIEVRYASEPFIRITSRGRERIHELMEAVATDSRPPYCGTLPREQLQPLRQLARLLVSGSQFADLHPSVVIASLASCVSEELHEIAAPTLPQRIDALRRAVERGDSSDPDLIISAGADLPAMMVAIAQHAAGFLAPLTAAIELGWDAEFLREGMTLVDLPGLGVANDQYRTRTAIAVEDLDAVLLVVDRSGISQASADLLRSTHVVARMVERAEQSERPLPELVIAVSKLDLPVDEEVLARKQSGAARLTWAQARAACTARARDVVRAQLAMELERLRTPERAVALERVKRRVAVLPVFPREYQRLNRADPDEPTRLNTVAESGIPALAFQMRRITSARVTDVVHACERAVEHLLAGPARPHAERCQAELRVLMTSRRGENTP